MIILSYGMTKSGSTLVYELCKAVLEQAGFEQRRLPDDVVMPRHHINFLNDVSTKTLERLLREVAPAEKIAIKLHAPIGKEEIAFVERKISDGVMAVHVNCRDPREVCLSLVDAGVQAREKNRPAFAEVHTLSDAAKIVQRQLRICRNWGSIAGARFYFYNDVAFSTRDVAEQMCEEFGIPKFDDKAYGAVADVVFNDAFTQKNKAIRDRYKDELTVRQNEMLLSEIKAAPRFINEVCRKRDVSWFSDIKKDASVDD